MEGGGKKKEKSKVAVSLAFMTSLACVIRYIHLPHVSDSAECSQCPIIQRPAPEGLFHLPTCYLWITCNSLTCSVCCLTQGG